MASPLLTQPKPYLVTLESGRTYFWCACGRSARQPFCDGSHAGTGLSPHRFVAERSEEVLLCGCKRTRGMPFCDGTHTNLPGGSPLDDPHSSANRAIPEITEQDGPHRWLDGGCYVVTPAVAPKAHTGTLSHCCIVGQDLGARHQTQFLLEAHDAAAPPVAFGASDVIVFVIDGSGTLEIAGRAFPVTATDGAYVRPGESLRLVPTRDEPLRVFALASPPAALQWPEQTSGSFDDEFPHRVVRVNAAQRTAMGPRYFQILVDKQIGSRVVTQFIGHIPRSKAAAHRHLYEETIIVLSGHGFMWTETRKTRVGPGEVIFLPRKQLHSLEATTEEGLFVVGVICPGDNPSINYYD